MTQWASRLFAAAPDLLTAALFLLAWTAPERAGAGRVNDLVLAAFLAAFSIFAGIVYTLLVKSGGPRLQNAFALLVMAAALMFILSNYLGDAAQEARHELGFTVAQPARMLPFLWMYAGQFLHLLLSRPRDTAAEARRMETLSVLSVIAYVGAFLVAIALPLPPFGITPEFVAGLHRGEDFWGTHLYIPLAFGALYFALQGVIKFAVSAPAPRVPAHD